VDLTGRVVRPWWIKSPNPLGQQPYDKGDHNCPFGSTLPKKSVAGKKKHRRRNIRGANDAAAISRLPIPPHRCASLHPCTPASLSMQEQLARRLRQSRWCMVAAQMYLGVW
jgi:hypothetical protein